MNTTLVVNEETFTVTKEELDAAGYRAIPVTFSQNKNLLPCRGYLAMKKKGGTFGLRTGKYPSRVHQHLEPWSRYKGEKFGNWNGCPSKLHTVTGIIEILDEKRDNTIPMPCWTLLW